MAAKITEYLGAGLEPSRAAEPIVLLLHGYGSNERDLAELMPYLPRHKRWIAPRGPLPTVQNGFAWAPLSTPGNPDPTEVAHGTNRLWNFIDSVIGTAAPLILIGFSQGGLMATQLLRTRPERIAKTGILAGFVVAADQPADPWLAEHKPRVLYCRGAVDQVISEDAIERTEAWLAAHTIAETHVYPRLGHSVDDRVLADLASYLN
jgi:phospholipase/carboxylesterase